ncbi:MAG: HD-GYP domain-containing protein, partial [Solirubrobacteraceae bacterium]
MLVTGAVLLGPVAISWALAADGVISSIWAAVLLGSATSVVVNQLGGLWWARHRRSADFLFSDLLLWGWLRRRSMQHRLANAARLFPATARGEASSELPLKDPLAFLRQLAADLEATDPYTHGHSRRVARYASLIARGMDLPPAEVRQIRLAAVLHDIGKLHTPRTILDKPGRLTEDEFAVIKCHPDDGADMIQLAIDDPELAAIVRHHHERLDGRGYPNGLAAEQIPLGARIIAVADTFDAISSKRAYLESRPHKTALDIMRGEAGAQLDPDAVRAFRAAYFGHRWLWLPAAALNAAGRLLVGSAAHLADTAAVAAGA